MKLFPLAHDDATDRDLVLLERASLDPLDPLALPSPHCAVLVVADARALSDGALHRLAAWLLRAGAVHLSAWGPACERVHDVFDDAVLFAEIRSTEASVIMTAWLESDLDDALAYFLLCTAPAQDYAETCRTGVVLVIGDRPDWSAAVRAALSDPAGFAARMA
jgi:hypothetical protein